MLKLDRDKLISAVYAASMSTDGYDEIMETIDELVFRPNVDTTQNGLVHNADVYRQYTVDPELLAHFERAHDIQSRLGRQRPEKPKVQILLDVAPNPAFVFDASENIIAVNELAEKFSPIQCNTLADCCDNKYVLANIRKFIRSENGQKLLVESGYINAMQNTNTCILVRKIGTSSDFGLLAKKDMRAENAQSEKLYFFTIVNLGFDSSKTALFQQTYSLTRAEVDIAVGLACGKQLLEIATERGAAVSTIRTQFKLVKKKTGSRDIPSVVRLLCGFSAGILISAQMSDYPKVDNSGKTNLKSRNQISLRDGRKMAYLEQGSPDGIPVILLHTMPYGQGILKDTIEAANRMGLRFISPFRPGYGASKCQKTSVATKF